MTEQQSHYSTRHGTYPEVEKLDHMVVLFLLFKAPLSSFSIVALPIYQEGSRTSSPHPCHRLFNLTGPALHCSVRGLQLSVPPCFVSCLFDGDHFNRHEGHLIVVLVCISLIAVILSFFSCDLCDCALEKYLFRPFPQFLIGLFGFLPLNCVSSLYILDINPLLDTQFEIFFPIPFFVFFHIADGFFCLLTKAFQFDMVLLVYFCILGLCLRYPIQKIFTKAHVRECYSCVYSFIPYFFQEEIRPDFRTYI